MTYKTSNGTWLTEDVCAQIQQSMTGDLNGLQMFEGERRVKVFMTNFTRAHFEALDQDDPLGALRDEFVMADGLIYLDGNSLGAQPRVAIERAREVIEKEWGQDLIRSWNTNGWFDMPHTLGNKLARLIGAKEGEVVVTDSTGIDLYKVLSAALQLRPERNVIIMEGSNFPTDNYVAQGLVGQLGDAAEIRFTEGEEIIAAIDESVAVVSLTQVHYKTGRILDMAAITTRAHEMGAVIIWDLCHSAGALPVELNACEADFAVGCTYKYLNGGPGSPGFIFVAKRHQGQFVQPLTGWWGHADPFAFERDYRPATDIRQMLSGTQPMISLCVTECGLDLALSADQGQQREKSMALTRLFIKLVESRCANQGFDLVSPREDQCRGSQVSFDHEYGYAIMQALIEAEVIGDFRAPHNMRFGFAPLYNRYADVWDAVDRLARIMDSGSWRDPKFKLRSAVT